jgi:protoheme IX farnesyltransferase
MRVAMKIHAMSLPVVRSRSSDFFALTKPRLNFLVVATATGGFYMGATSDSSVQALVHTVIGTALVAGGSGAFNMAMEARPDSLMKRTRTRPVADGRLRPVDAMAFGSLLAGVGLAELALAVNPLAALVAFATFLAYIVFYTPLKLRTQLSTLVGAVPGALPPMIGWAGATGTLSLEGWLLFAIIFLWQMPHFLALAWMYREDYARAGFPLLPVIEPDGMSTARHSITYAAALLPVSLTPTLVGMTSGLYFAGALLLGSVMLWATWHFARTPTCRCCGRSWWRRGCEGQKQEARSKKWEEAGRWKLEAGQRTPPAGTWDAGPRHGILRSRESRHPRPGSSDPTRLALWCR